MKPEKISFSPDAMFQEIGGEGVILDLKSATYFGLDEVGVRFWQLAQSEPSVSVVCELLLQEYDIDAGSLEKDIGMLVDQLVDAGLVVAA